MLRISGGLYKGMRLYCPRDIRPTSGRIKEYIFSQVGEFTRGSRIADLYAGSGALGIEALSRRAQEAVFVDKSRRAVAAIRKNLLKINNKSKVLKSDTLQYIKHFKHKPFDIIFIDPPYREVDPQVIMEAVEKSDILQKGGHLVLEICADCREPESEFLLPNSFRTLGDTAVGIWFRPG